METEDWFASLRVYHLILALSCKALEMRIKCGVLGGWEEGAQALVAYGRECFVWLMVVI